MKICTTVCYNRKLHTEGMFFPPSLRVSLFDNCSSLKILICTARNQGFVWFCFCVYLLHLQDRTTLTRYLRLVPSLQCTVTFRLRTSSATQRHSRLWRLIILENSGNQGSSSIGKHFPSQIVSRMGLLLVQKPFDKYLRIRMPWHPRLRMPVKE